MAGRIATERKAGDDRFTAAVQSYIDSLRRYCRSLAGSSWDGDDLFQTSMMKAFRAWKTRPLRPVSKAWLFRIARNAWIDAHRKVSVEEIVREDIEEIADRREAVDNEKLMVGMKLLIERLTAKQRLVFLLVAGLNFSAKDVSALTGESEGNVRVLYHRGKRQLVGETGRRQSRSVDDTETTRYVRALRSGNPKELLRLYRQDIRAAIGASPAYASDALRPDYAPPLGGPIRRISGSRIRMLIRSHSAAA